MGYKFDVIFLKLFFGYYDEYEVNLERLCDLSKINISATHPRENKNFPKVGIFSQRKKARPNLLGTTIVKLLSVKNNVLTVEGLDAVNGTPIIDIKPVLKEFLPEGRLIQPDWATELMKDYWRKKI